MRDPDIDMQQPNLCSILHSQGVRENWSLAVLMGELARKTGLSKDTIRFYEKIGLITAQEPQAETRFYKEFSEDTVERLFTIN